MKTVYLVLGALSFWFTVGAVLLVGSVWLAEWSKDRTDRRRIGGVVDPFTKSQTDRLVRQWRQ